LKNIISGIITSKLKVKILMRFFLNPDSQSYLRGLASELNVSSNSIRTELNNLSASKLITHTKTGRKILYKANKHHPLFSELKSMAKKVMGIDKVIESIIARLGNIETAYLLDDYAIGRDNGIIDLLLVGDIDNFHLHDLTKKTERYLKRKIRLLVLTKDEFKDFKQKLDKRPSLLIWGVPNT